MFAQKGTIVVTAYWWTEIQNTSYKIVKVGILMGDAAIKWKCIQFYLSCTKVGQNLKKKESNPQVDPVSAAGDRLIGLENAGARACTRGLSPGTYSHGPGRGAAWSSSPADQASQNPGMNASATSAK